MFNPTDELCAKLDELGIKYTADDSNDYEAIEWQGSYNLWWQFVYDLYDGEPYGELRLLDTGSTHLTPKQAIAVTVGERNPDGLPIGLTISNDGNLLNWMGENYVRQDAATVCAGTCHDADVGGYFVCSECEALVKLHSIGRSYVDGYGKRWYATSNNHSLNFCPNCGRRIEVNE